MGKKLWVWYGLAGVGALLFFVFFSYLVHKDLFTSLDFDTTVRLQDKIPRRVDPLFSLFSLIGNFEVATAVLLGLLVLIRKIKAVTAVVLFGAFHFLEIFGKYFVNHPPPPHFLLRTEHPVDFPQFYVSTEFSYPSGHSARAAFLTIIILAWLLHVKRIPMWGKLSILSIVFAYDITMFVSRVYLGEHWLTDVIGGIFLGAAFGLFSAVFI